MKTLRLLVLFCLTLLLLGGALRHRDVLLQYAGLVAAAPARIEAIQDAQAPLRRIEAAIDEADPPRAR